MLILVSQSSAPGWQSPQAGASTAEHTPTSTAVTALAVLIRLLPCSILPTIASYPQAQGFASAQATASIVIMDQTMARGSGMPTSISSAVGAHEAVAHNYERNSVRRKQEQHT